MIITPTPPISPTKALSVNITVPDGTAPTIHHGTPTHGTLLGAAAVEVLLRFTPHNILTGTHFTTTSTGGRGAREKCIHLGVAKPPQKFSVGFQTPHSVVYKLP